MYYKHRGLLIAVVSVLLFSMVACDIGTGGLLGELLENDAVQTEREQDDKDYPESVFEGFATEIETSQGTSEDRWPLETTGEVMTEPPMETTRDPFADDLPTLQFGGEQVIILTKDKAGVRDEFFSAYSAETQSDVVSLAVYKRNKAVEERLNVNLEVLLEEEPTTKHELAVSTGASDYDIVVDSTYLFVQSMLNGSYVNLRDVPNLDLSKPYWNQSYSEMVSFGETGKQCLASGDIALSMLRYAFVTAYNKDVFEQLGETDLHEVVNNGEWTLDYQNQIIADRYQDSGETPDKRDETDMYGLITGDTVSVDPYCVAGDLELISKGEDGAWFYNTDQFERAVELCEKVQALYNNTSTYVFKSDAYDNTGKTDIIEAFARSSSMMATVQIYAIEQCVGDLAQMNCGIVPMPKFDQYQQNYATYVQDQVSAVGICSVRDEYSLSMIGAVLECMASESHAFVTEAYCSVALPSAFLQDAESVEMFELIYDSLIFDFIGSCSDLLFINGGQSYRDQFRPLFSGQSTKLGSYLAKWEKSTNKALSKINELHDNWGK